MRVFGPPIIKPPLHYVWCFAWTFLLLFTALGLLCNSIIISIPDEYIKHVAGFCACQAAFGASCYALIQFVHDKQGKV